MGEGLVCKYVPYKHADLSWNPLIKLQVEAVWFFGLLYIQPLAGIKATKNLLSASFVILKHKKIVT